MCAFPRISLNFFGAFCERSEQNSGEKIFDKFLCCVSVSVLFRRKIHIDCLCDCTPPPGIMHVVRRGFSTAVWGVWRSCVMIGRCVLYGPVIVLWLVGVYHVDPGIVLLLVSMYHVELKVLTILLYISLVPIYNKYELDIIAILVCISGFLLNFRAYSIIFCTYCGL